MHDGGRNDGAIFDVFSNANDPGAIVDKIVNWTMARRPGHS